MARRTLDRRTVLRSAGLALVAAVIAGAVAYALLSDGDSNEPEGTLELTDAAAVDPDDLLTVPLDTPDGEPTDLAELGVGDGRRALVNFWQSSCAPCIDEMPMLDAAAADHPDVVFVGVASQDPPDDAARLADQTGISYPWALDPDAALFNAAQAAGMPTTLLLDADGAILTTKTGAFTSEGELNEFLEVGD